MKYIVRIVSDEAFQGLVTSYVGPFANKVEAELYIEELEAYHCGEADFYLEPLHAPGAPGAPC